MASGCIHLSNFLCIVVHYPYIGIHSFCLFSGGIISRKWIGTSSCSIWSSIARRYWGWVSLMATLVKLYWTIIVRVWMIKNLPCGHIWPFSKTLSSATLTIQQPYSYGHSGKFGHTLFRTVTIQQTYMVDFRYYRKLLCIFQHKSYKCFYESGRQKR